MDSNNNLNNLNNNNNDNKNNLNNVNSNNDNKNNKSTFLKIGDLVCLYHVDVSCKKRKKKKKKTKKKKTKKRGYNKANYKFFLRFDLFFEVLKCPDFFQGSCIVVEKRLNSHEKFFF